MMGGNGRLAVELRITLPDDHLNELVDGLRLIADYECSCPPVISRVFAHDVAELIRVKRLQAARADAPLTVEAR